MRALGVIGTLVLAGGTTLAALVPLDTAHAGTLSVIHVFTGGSDGANPSGLMEDAAGNLYGTTGEGGSYVCFGGGTVFKIAPDGTKTLLYAFAGGSDGCLPAGNLIEDKAGDFYGTTIYGGGAGCQYGIGCGTVFKLAPDGTETVLYAFTGGSDGAYANAGVIEDAAGNLYGTSEQGGNTGGHCTANGNTGCGVVFKISPKGKETTLYAFQGGTDGNVPFSGLIEDESGNLYGTTLWGGHHGCTYGCGTIFKLAPDGTETVLHAFIHGTDGAEPGAGVIRDASGNLYGTTPSGGPYNKGTVFRLAPDGTETVLHAFAGGTDGAHSWARVIRDKSGNVYGTTADGGANHGGTLFKLAPDGTDTILYAFGRHSGKQPLIGVIRETHGNLYGGTSIGPNQAYGTVFRLAE
jgi:uncharacterized repeat protein (TIGR03803 family)